MLATMLAAAALFAPAPQTAAPQTAGYLLSANFERLSDLPYGPDLIRMFEPAGYFRGFAAANVDLAATFDHVEDLRSVTATFVIGNSSLSRDQLQKTLEAVFTATGQTIAWADHHGSLAGTPTKVDGAPGADPRWYVLLADGSMDLNLLMVFEAVYREHHRPILRPRVRDAHETSRRAPTREDDSQRDPTLRPHASYVSSRGPRRHFRAGKIKTDPRSPPPATGVGSRSALVIVGSWSRAHTRPWQTLATRTS